MDNTYMCMYARIYMSMYIYFTDLGVGTMSTNNIEIDI